MLSGLQAHIISVYSSVVIEHRHQFKSHYLVQDFYFLKPLMMGHEELITITVFNIVPEQGSVKGIHVKTH